MPDSPMIEYTGTPVSGESAAQNMKPVFAKRAKSNMARRAKMAAARDCMKRSMAGKK